MASFTHWLPGSPFPENALHAGFDIDGSKIYVGRAWYNGDLIPAKVMPDKDAAYIAYGGEEMFVSGCEVLLQPTYAWVPCSGDQVPSNAVAVGKTGEGETLFAGRVYHEGSHTIGKVHPSHGCCYIPFGGQEVKHCSYEVLVLHSG